MSETLQMVKVRISCIIKNIGNQMDTFDEKISTLKIKKQDIIASVLFFWNLHTLTWAQCRALTSMKHALHPRVLLGSANYTFMIASVEV